MEKVIHICFSHSICGSINFAISKQMIKGDKVIIFSDDLSNGPIHNLDLKTRKQWWSTLVEKDEFNYIEDIEDEFKVFFQEITSIKNEDIYIWYADNAAEICATSYMMELLKNKIDNLYIINVSKITFNKGKKNEYTPRRTGEISHNKLSDFINIKNKVDKNIYCNLTKLWNKLKKENTLFRVYENAEMLSVSEDYIDEFILGYTNDDFIKCARVVGECLGYSKIHISDNFVLWRILELIKLNKIEYRGNLGIMREMEVKQGKSVYIRNYNKLVRDNIPKIIEADGKKIKFKKLDGEDYLEALNEKLEEELSEYLLNNDIKELIDLMEVIHAILDYKKISIEEFEKIRLDKKRINGGFKEKLFLMNVKNT